MAGRASIIATAVILAALVGDVTAQYPSRAIQIVVPFGSGATDVAARTTASCLAAKYRQPVVVINRPGANGMIGAQSVKSAPPDGHTLLYGASTLVTDLALSASPGFDVRTDLEPITKVVYGVRGMYVPAALPVNSVAEFVAHVKANPGRLNYGSLGVGSVNQLTAEALAMAAGLRMVHVPYPKGAATMLVGLMNNEIQLVMTDATAAQPTLDTGRVKLLAVLADQRMGSRPGVPTLAESIPAMAPFMGTLWYGYFAPLHTPRDIVERLYADLKACHDDDAVRAQFRKLGYEAPQIVSNRPEVFRAAIAEEVARLTDLVQAANIRLR